MFTENLDQAKFYMGVARELAEWNIETLGLIVSLIIGFYFGGGLIEGGLSKIRK